VECLEEAPRWQAKEKRLKDQVSRRPLTFR
jgi:hypothetical protein